MRSKAEDDEGRPGLREQILLWISQKHPVGQTNARNRRNEKSTGRALSLISIPGSLARMMMSHQKEELVMVLRVDIQEDAPMPDVEAAALARRLLERNNWDIVRAAAAYTRRPPSATSAAGGSATRSSAGEVFYDQQMQSIMRRVLKLADQDPAPSLHEVRVHMPPHQVYPSDKEVQRMIVDAHAQGQGYEAGPSLQLQVGAMVEMQFVDGQWYAAEVIRYDPVTERFRIIFEYNGHTQMISPRDHRLRLRAGVLLCLPECV